MFIVTWQVEYEIFSKIINLGRYTNGFLDTSSDMIKKVFVSDQLKKTTAETEKGEKSEESADGENSNNELTEKAFLDVTGIYVAKTITHVSKAYKFGQIYNGGRRISKKSYWPYAFNFGYDIWITAWHTKVEDEFIYKDNEKFTKEITRLHFMISRFGDKDKEEQIYKNLTIVEEHYTDLKLLKIIRDTRSNHSVFIIYEGLDKNGIRKKLVKVLKLIPTKFTIKGIRVSFSATADIDSFDDLREYASMNSYTNLPVRRKHRSLRFVHSFLDEGYDK